ncbi:hypothetical protein [Bradyrhizobium sp. CCGB20]|uniref:hypothetical protein n=1 Tax=Bradyrhizobium sp. CCGB20 TaxID=2949633 RepID=UPI0020B18F32|nr:hypothetical protein [Bradyrhizobium sp. CCGB20]MCP3401904.1 hypothetical protein [Bradyrhizobium sp. CCGB20]
MRATNVALNRAQEWKNNAHTATRLAAANEAGKQEHEDTGSGFCLTGFHGLSTIGRWRLLHMLESFLRSKPAPKRWFLRRNSAARQALMLAGTKESPWLKTFDPAPQDKHAKDPNQNEQGKDERRGARQLPSVGSGQQHAGIEGAA